MFYKKFETTIWIKDSWGREVESSIGKGQTNEFYLKVCSHSFFLFLYDWIQYLKDWQTHKYNLNFDIKGKVEVIQLKHDLGEQI